MKDFYKQKYASKANSTSKTEDLYDSTMNLSSISTISSINQDDTTPVSFVNSILPPPPPTQPSSNAFRPRLKKAQTLEAPMPIVKPCRSRHHSRSKSKQRDSSLSNKNLQHSQSSSHTILTKPEELQSMINELIDLKLGLKQNSLTLTLTPEKLPPKTLNKNTMDSASTQTKITHKRFYSPEKLPDFYKNSLNEIKLDLSNNLTTNLTNPLPTQHSHRQSRNEASNLNDEQTSKLVSRETQTTGKLIQMKRQQKTNNNEIEPTPASLNVLNELNSKFNNEPSIYKRVKSNSVDIRYYWLFRLNHRLMAPHKAFTRILHA